MGYFAGAIGSATVSGSSSAWSNSLSTIVGSSGTGSLTVSAGGLVSDSFGVLGSVAGSDGTATITGTNSRWNNTSNLFVGDSGAGTLAINGGGLVNNATGYVGDDAGAIGDVTVDGMGSIWTNSGDLYVGNAGNGTLNVTGGGVASNVDGYVGNLAGSTGNVTVDGMGSRWTNTGDLDVGILGQGILTIQNDGTVEVIDQLTVNDLSTVNLSGGTLRVGSMSSTENLNWAAGTLEFASADFRVESGGQFGDTLTIDLTRTLIASKVDGDHAVGELSPGMMTVDGGTASFPNGGLFIGPQGKVMVTSGGHVSGGISLAPDGELVINGAASSAAFGRTTIDAFGKSYSVVNGQITLTNGKVLVTAVDIYEISNGSITVDGPLTRWRHQDIDGFVSVAYAQTVAELIIDDGGRASVPELVVGEAGGTGTVRISGVGFHESLGPTPSTLYVGSDPVAAGPGDLHIGAQFEDSSDASSGLIEVLAGGQLNVKHHTYMSSVGSTAAVTVDGAGSHWNNEGDIFVGYSGNPDHGFGDATILISNGGTVVSDNGIVGVGNCSMGDCPSAQVTVDGSGSSWLMSNDLTVDNGIFTVSNSARVEAATVSTSSATELRGNGVIESFLVSAGGLVSPGMSVGALTIDGSYHHVSGAELFIELAPASQHDQLIVENDIELFGGTLSVELIDGFMPQAGDAFDILGFDELVGAFLTIDLPVLSGSLDWDTSQLYVSGVLAVVSNLPGDYNGNGVVDAADYTVWRNNLGSGMSLPNDNTAGVGQDDYERWKTHFGETVGGAGSAGASPSQSAVPEPATLAAMLGGLIAALFNLGVRRPASP